MPKKNPWELQPFAAAQKPAGNALTAQQVAALQSQARMNAAQDLYERYRNELEERLASGSSYVRPNGAERAYRDQMYEALYRANSNHATRDDVMEYNYLAGMYNQTPQTREEMDRQKYAKYDVSAAQKRYYDLLKRSLPAAFGGGGQTKLTEARNKLGSEINAAMRYQPAGTPGVTERGAGQQAKFVWNGIEYASIDDFYDNVDLDELQQQIKDVKTSGFLNAFENYNNAARTVSAVSRAAQNAVAANSGQSGTMTAAELQQIYNIAEERQRYNKYEQTVADFNKRMEADPELAGQIDAFLYAQPEQTNRPSADWDWNPDAPASTGNWDINPDETYSAQWTRARAQAFEPLRAKGYTEDQILAYLDAKTRLENRENTQREVEQARENAAKGGWNAAWEIAKGVGRRLVGGPMGSLRATFQQMNGDPVDWYDPYQSWGLQAKAVTGQISEDIDSPVVSFLYQMGESALDMTAVALTAKLGIPPLVGTSLMGGSAGQQAMFEAKERGISDDKAVATGIAAGIFETLFERVSLEQLLKPKAITAKTFSGKLLQVMKNVGVQGFTEGSEEVFTSLANDAFDRIVNGGQSEYETNVRNYMASGMSADEARKAATTDFAVSLAMDFGGGALLGGVMGGGATAVDTALNTVAANREANRVYGSDSAALVQEALEIDPDNKTARDAMQTLVSGGELSGATIRKLVEQNDARIAETQNTGTVETDSHGPAALGMTENVDPVLAEHAAEFGGAADVSAQANPLRRMAAEFGYAAQDFVDAIRDGQNVEDYYTGFKLAYDVGRANAGGTARIDSETMDDIAQTYGLRDDQVDLAYKLGRAEANRIEGTETGETDSHGPQAALGMTETEEGADNGTEQTEGARVRDGGQRDDGQSAGGESGTVAEGTAVRQYKSRPADSGAAAFTFAREGRSTAQLIGASQGSAADSLRIVTGGHSAAVRGAVKVAQERGLTPHFFAGGDMTVTKNGQTVKARGYIQGKTAFIRADDPDFTADQIMRHEIGHDMIDEGEVDTEEVRERLRKRFSEEELDRVAQLYADLYAGSGLTADEIWEEIICDSLGDMNVFSGTVAEHIAPVSAFLESAKQETLAQKKDARGPPNGERESDLVSGGRTSIRTYREGGREQLKMYLEQRVKDKAVTREEANDMISQMDEMYDICNAFADRYALFGQWSEAEVRVDPKTGNPIFSVVKANGEYAMNLDFSLICKKRRTLDAVFQQMIEDGIMDNFDMKESSIALINDIIRDNDFETACALCFVDSKRYRQAIVADAFVGMYNDLVRSMIKPGQHADAFNFGGSGLIVNDGKGIDTLKDSDLDFSRINEVLKTEGKKTVLYKIAKDLKEHAEDRKVLMRGDFMSGKAFDTIKATNQRIMGLYNAKKGAGGPKASSLDVQYLNEIISQKKFNADKAYSVGGVRIQSFSDYMPRMVFDYLQMIADMQAKRLPAHAYTKEPLFILQFGLTGIKGNMSLVPEVVEGGVAPGLDKDGNYAWRDGQSFGSTVYGGSKEFIKKCYEIIGKKYNGQTRLTAAEGFELAKAIQSAEGYGVNCGTIAVGVSDDHIRKMLRDPDIRMVIPYHKSSLNHIVAVMTNIDKYDDYTGVQNTRKADGTKLAKGQKDFNFNEALLRLGDAKAAADEYLAWCDKKGYLPKFDRFRNEEGYYKLLEDFTTYDMNGEAAPQQGVTLTLPTEESAFGSMKDMIRMGLEEDALLQGKQDAAVPKMVEQIKRILPGFEAQQRAKNAGHTSMAVRRSSRDAEYMELVEKYENETGYQKSYTEDDLDRLVAAAAKEHGYTTPKIYHGTRSFGFTVFDTSGTKPYAQKGYIYASTKRQVAANYAGDNHYAGVRSIGTKYDGGSSAESIIKDAKSVYGTTYRKPTKEDIDNRIRKDYAEAQKVSEKLNELWPPLDNIPQEVANAVDWMTDIINTTVDNDLAWQVGADGIINGTNEEKADLQKQLQHDFGRLEADRALVRDYYDEHRSEMNDDQKKYFSYLMSYEFGDALIDIQYGLCQVLTPDNLLINGDSFADMANLREAMDEVHNIGAYQLYGDLGDKPFIFDANGAQFWALKVPEVSDGYTDTDAVCKWAKAHGYTSVVMKNIYDYGDKADNYVFFNSEQVKSADPATYDDNGNVIPLSERFNTEKDDIRFSQTSDELAALRQENAELTEKVKSFEKELRKVEKNLADARESRDNWRNKATFSPERVGREIIKAYDGTVKEAEIHDAVKAIIDHAARKSGISFEKMKDMAMPVAQKIISSAEAVANSEEVRTWEDIKKYHRETKLKLTQEVLADFRDEPDFKHDFYRLYGRPLNLNNKGEGLAIDVAYAEMGEQFGYDLYPDSITHPADQLRRMAEIRESLQPVMENPYSLNMAMATEHCANELVDRVMSEVARGYKATYAGRLEEQLYQTRKSVRDMVLAERQRSDEQMRSLKQHWKEQQRAQGEKRMESEERDRLLKIARRLQNKKLPAAQRSLLDQYIGDLDTVSRSLTGRTLGDLNWLEHWYNEQKADKDFIPDPATEARIRRLYEKHIDDMSREDVLDLTYTLLNIENEMRTKNRLIESKEKRDVFEAGLQLIRDMENAPGSRASGVRSAIDKLIVTETLSPVRQARRVTGYADGSPLTVAVNELADGQRKAQDYEMRALKRFEHFLDDKKFVQEIAGEKAREISIRGIGTDGPVEVQITPAMRISLYLHSLNAQNLRHIAGGGVTVPDMKLYKQGKIQEAYARGTTVKLTPSQVRSITARMSAQEMRFAQVAREYFNTESKDSINAVSEKLKGYSIAQVDNYFPINTDTSFTKKEFDSIKFDGTIEGMGFLKERVNSASPIMLRDLNSVLTQAISMHAKYVGLAVPVRNFNKLWGVTAHNVTGDGDLGASSSVQQTMGQQWGEASRKYFEKLMSDLQTGGREQNNWDKVFARVRSNYAGAVLTLNMSVAMKQAASYPTAAAVVGWSPLVKAFKNFGKVDLDLVAAYTPLQWYRSRGFSTQELGDMAKRGKQLPAALNWVQAMDVWTTRKLWKAAEIYVADNFKGLERGTAEQIRKGESPFFRQVAEIYNRIIEETQPNYTTMQRPQMLRSDSTLLQNLAMFKTQPFQNFNILYDAVGELNARERAWKNTGTEESRTALREAKRKAWLAVSSQAVQLAVFAMMTAAWNAFRRKKDKYAGENGDVTFLSVLKALGLDMIGGLFSEVPFGGDVWEFTSAMASNGRYNGIDDVTASALTDTVTALGNAGKTVSGLLKGEITDFNTFRLKMDPVLDAVSKTAGVPYENVLNVMKALYRNGAHIFKDDYLGEYDYLCLTTSPEKAAPYYDLLFEAYRKDPRAFEMLYQKMGESGNFDADKMEGGLSDRRAEQVGTVKENVSTVIRYARSGDRSGAVKAAAMIEEWYRFKVESSLRKGKSREDAEKDARSSILTSATNVIKPLYLAGETALAAEIMGYLTVNGVNLYDGYDYAKRWTE